MFTGRNQDQENVNQEKIDFRNPDVNPNMKKPTAEELSERLESGTAKDPSRKEVFRQILKKTKKENSSFTGPEYLSPKDEQDLYSLPQMISVNAMREGINFIPSYASNWISDQTNQNTRPMLTINANAQIVGGHLWTERGLAQ